MINKPSVSCLSPRSLTFELGAALLLCLLPAALPAATNTWDGGGANELASNRTNWSDDIAPVAGDHIVLDATSHKSMTWNMTNMTVASWTQAGYNGTVTVATVYNPAGFTNLNITGNCIISNGILTHTVNTASQLYRLKMTIGGDLVIGPAGLINVSTKGHSTKQGPGQYVGTDGTSSHGGRGWSGNLCYGSAVAPTNIGSGGRESNGGGAILIEVAGTIRNNGAIRADSGPTSWGSGSGGSIWLIAGALEGSGTNSANGGRASSDQNRASGGGRIALVVTNEGADFASFTGTNTAFALGPGGAAGTIYLEKKADEGKGELIINNLGGSRGYAAYNTALGGRGGVTGAFSRVTLTNNAILDIAAGETMIVSNAVFTCANGIINGIFVAGGAIITESDFVFSNFFIGITAIGTTFSPATSLTIGDNAELRIDKPHEMACDMIIAPGGKLTHTANGSAETYKLDLSLQGNVTVQAGGAINVIGKGYAANSGPGTPVGNNCGGSHGGLGVGGLSCYGSIAAPTNLGSGGRSGGAGGGAIIMAVSGTVSNNGLISASATPVTQRTGAGGSVYITAGAMAGDGVIEANSATNVTSDSPGGGGRVALAVTNAGAVLSGYAGPITAYGGRKIPASGMSGGAGTVYLREAGQGLCEGALIVDNNSQTGLVTEISAAMTDIAVADVLIRRKGSLLLTTNKMLSVGGVWSNAASFTGQWDSAVIFTGGAGSTSTLYGATTFKGLICTNAGRTLVFEAGATNRVAESGRLWLRGTALAPVILRSTLLGAEWNLEADSSADQSVQAVDVADSDASGGAEIMAINSTDSTGNTNWRFLTAAPGETITWTGGVSTVWSVPGNWDLSRYPIATDVIVIPGGCERYPALDASRTVNHLTIQAGASLSLEARDLTVTNCLVVEGSLIAAGYETVRILKDADFTGGSFDAARSTLLLAGGDLQSLNLAGVEFHKILVGNMAAPMTISGGFTASELRCEAPDGTRTLLFEPGKTVHVRDLMLLGSASEKNILLRSASPGQKWNLSISGYEKVQGVDAQDSDATHGQAVTATSSKDSGGNLNWMFDYTWTEWLGTSGVNFHQAANWSPAGVPDGSTRVLVESANPMTITGAVSVLDLTIGGGTGRASVTVYGALTVAEDVVVMTNSTLALNRPCVISNTLVVMGGGMLTHNGPQVSETNKLNLTVYGDVGVEENGVINVTSKGYGIKLGPGRPINNSDNAGSYGGHGWALTGAGPCYGSILAPTNLGSGGRSSYGGGAILITATGVIRNDGLMAADGMPADYGGGSGGSIMLRSGALIGNGIIRADGGRAIADSKRSGGGGRISLTVTNEGAGFSGLATNLITVLGGPVYTPPSGGPGTIYYQDARAQPGCGLVIVANNNHTDVPYCDVPSSSHGVAGEADRAVFKITDGSRFRLTNDFTVGDIYLGTANSWLDLGGKTLTVRTEEHSLNPGIVTNYGEIIWLPVHKGSLFIVR